MGSGNVTTRGYDAPVVSADDHWNIAQLGPVAFLYGGVESVAVEMGDGEAMKLLVPRDVRRPTGRAGFGTRRWLGVAVTAQSFHGTIIGLNVSRSKRSGHGILLNPVCQEELFNPGRDVSINPKENPILTPQRPVPDVRLGYASTGQCKIIRGIGLLLAEGYLNRRLFGDMLRRLSALPVPGG